ncbi:MAG: HD domain-containing protein, partial [Pirellulales bacterium]
RPVAVIDIGTTAIRMAVAEIREGGTVHKLETLSQDVQLGQDTFRRGRIEHDTIEDCVRVLRSYRKVLDEYQIAQSDQIRIVATSAVREAVNGLAFIDRMYVATGLWVELADEAEVSRITYLGVQPFLKEESALADATVLVIEVGGGNTEVLAVRRGEVLFSHHYKLGSLRLRETLEAYRAPTSQLRTIMASQIRRTAEQVRQSLTDQENLEMIAMGGDIRIAAQQLLTDWDMARMGKLRVKSLEQFTSKVLDQNIDELVRRYHLTFADAETLGPALLAYVELANALRLKQVFVTNVNLWDGLLMEMTASPQWTADSVRPVIQSALDLGKKYHVDARHARHVADLAKQFFQELQQEHQLGPRYELLLEIAALLHEIGMFVNMVSHHKHTLYLITNSELFGLNSQDLSLIGLIARYHRRGLPKPSHDKYGTLDREQRIAVAKLSAILRVADALDHSRSQRIQRFACSRENGQLVITVPRVDDLSLEQLALREKGPLFEEIFGTPVLLRKGSE